MLEQISAGFEKSVGFRLQQPY